MTTDWDKFNSVERKLLLWEVLYIIQGEAPRVGSPTFCELSMGPSYRMALAHPDKF